MHIAAVIAPVPFWGYPGCSIWGHQFCCIAFCTLSKAMPFLPACLPAWQGSSGPEAPSPPHPLGAAFRLSKAVGAGGGAWRMAQCHAWCQRDECDATHASAQCPLRPVAACCLNSNLRSLSALSEAVVRDGLGPRPPPQAPSCQPCPALKQSRYSAQATADKPLVNPPPLPACLLPYARIWLCCLWR